MRQTFFAVRDDVRRMLEGAVFVAHNARFDYGFIKNEFRRQQEAFTADVLCTVRLSRRLYPNATGHGLDAIITRHHLDGFDRHRAMGDTEATAAFVQPQRRVVRQHGRRCGASLAAHAVTASQPARRSVALTFRTRRGLSVLRHQRHADLYIGRPNISVNGFGPTSPATHDAERRAAIAGDAAHRMDSDCR